MSAAKQRLLSKKPSGSSEFETWMVEVSESLEKLTPIDSPGVMCFDRTDKGWKPRIEVRGGGGNRGWFWPAGRRKYNPTVDGYSVDQVVKVCEDDAMVTAGIVCAGSVTKKATPGKWVALQGVPKLLNDGTDDPKYIPQLPLPGGTDPDDPDNYWELITPSSVCVDGVMVEL